MRARVPALPAPPVPAVRLRPSGRTTLVGSPVIDSRVAADASDEALLARIAERDVDALTSLYDRHRAAAYGLALRITGSVPTAEDVLQDAFLGAWRQAAGFDPRRGSGRAWLFAIVHHRAIDAIRRRRAADPLPDVEGAPSPAALVAPDIWPEVAGRLDAEAVRRALDGLSSVQREAIELAYWGGLTQAEIADRTGLPLGTVKGRMRLGLQALARALHEPTGQVGGGGRPDDASPAETGGRPAASDPDPGIVRRLAEAFALVAARGLGRRLAAGRGFAS